MPRYPDAQWRPVANETPNGMTGYRFLVLHIMQGTLAGTDTWFHNAASQVSAHFGVGKDGTVYQWVDTADKAWAQAAGNPIGISIEHEGSLPDALTPAQIAADSAILAWVHKTHGIPLQVTDDAGAGSGVCGHSTGAAANWGHPDCPGPAIMDQRQQIVDGATMLLSVPVVSGLTPSSGAGSGGDTVTVSGSGFTNAQSVLFGSVPGINLTVTSDSELSVTSPAPNACGAVDVTVATANGTSATSPADLFTYAAAAVAPTVSGLVPSSGAAAGGDTVTVSGAGLTGVDSVMFGSVEGTGLTVVSDSELTVTSPPPNVSGAVHVVVYTGEGSSDTSAADLFTYGIAAVAPVVSGVSPSSGAAGGGDAVTVSGTGFTGAESVQFGTVAATDLNVASDTELTVTSPAPISSGAVDVTVTTPAGTSATSAADQFTYAAAAATPVVSGVDPSTGAAGGGDAVTVSGTGFTGAESVQFGTVAATDLNVASDTELTVTSPAPISSGAVDVTVTTPAGTSATSAADQFTYAAAAATPVVSGVDPSTGAAGGGDAVTVSGTGFTGAESVQFGTVAATDLNVASDTELTVTSPAPISSGAVDVTVTTPAGTSATSAADQFTYAAALGAPDVSGVGPTSEDAKAGG